MTPAKGEYLVFSGPSEATLRTPVVPVPSKQTAGVYTFRRCTVIHDLYTYISSILAFIILQLAQYFLRILLRVLNSSVTFQMWVANFNFNYLSHFCINFENSCAHHQEEILTIPKHPQKSSF